MSTPTMRSNTTHRPPRRVTAARGRRSFIGLLVMILLLIAPGLGCSRREKHAEPAGTAQPEGDHKDEKEHEDLPKRVRPSEQVIADAKIRTESAKREALAITLDLPGEVAADPDRSARVASPVAGRIVSVRFKEGSDVKRGDVLATIRVPEISKIRSAQSSAASKGAAARANAERLQDLADKGLASKQEALSALAEADSLESEARAMREQLLTMGTSGQAGSELVLRAPVTGVVIARDAVLGQPITAEQTIASIVDLSEVWFLARVFEKDLGQLSTGAKAEVTLNAYPGEHFEGTLEYIARQIDPVARTLTARIQLRNQADRLRLGLFGTAQVLVSESSKRAPRIVVPRAALTEIAGKTVAFVHQKDGDFEVHELALGASALGKVEVLNGLREGENVVVEGVFTLKSMILRSSIAEDE